jgi:hypothetical protein
MPSQAVGSQLDVSSGGGGLRGRQVAADVDRSAARVVRRDNDQLVVVGLLAQDIHVGLKVVRVGRSFRRDAHGDPGQPTVVRAEQVGLLEAGRV